MKRNPRQFIECEVISFTINQPNILAKLSQRIKNPVTGIFAVFFCLMALAISLLAPPKMNITSGHLGQKMKVTVAPGQAELFEKVYFRNASFGGPDYMLVKLHPATESIEIFGKYKASMIPMNQLANLSIWYHPFPKASEQKQTTHDIVQSAYPGKKVFWHAS